MANNFLFLQFCQRSRSMWYFWQRTSTLLLFLDNSFVLFRSMMLMLLGCVTLSQFYSSKIRRSANFMLLKNAVRRISKLQSCKRAGREVSQSSNPTRGLEIARSWLEWFSRKMRLRSYDSIWIKKDLTRQNEKETSKVFFLSLIVLSNRYRFSS